ncbi:MAG: type II secretion system F family protein [Planctomycetota bacterium]
MPQFAYKARALDGTTTQGSISAPSRREAINELRQRSLFPITLKDTQGPTVPLLELIKPQGVSAEVLATNLNQMADLLENGVALLETLDVLAKESTHPRLGKIFGEVRAAVSEGIALEEALSKYPQVFPDVAVSIIRAGAEGGFLEGALRRVAEYLERQAELKGRITSAMAYPIFLIVAGVLVTIFLMLFIVPRFQQLFDRLVESGAGLPLITEVLLSTRLIMINQGWLILIGCVGIFFAVRHFLSTAWGRQLVDRWVLHLPIMGDIVRQSAVSRFCRILGTLLANGVPLLRSLEISSKSIGNKLLEQAIIASAQNVSAGETLSKPLTSSGLIPPATMAMIRIAEESNSLEQVLLKIADTSDKKIQRRLDILVRMIEPIMLLIIAAAVLFILLGLLLPVYDMSNAIG